MISPDGGSYEAGSNMTVTWNRGNNLPNGTYYFVYLKTKPDQILGSESWYGEYYPLVFRSTNLGHSSFSITLPSDVPAKGSSPITPGRYYLEIDMTDSNGNPFASVTSSQFYITSSNQTNNFPPVIHGVSDPKFKSW